jgi:hypothetical protein
VVVNSCAISAGFLEEDGPVSGAFKERGAVWKEQGAIWTGVFGAFDLAKVGVYLLAVWRSLNPPMFMCAYECPG